MSCRCSELLWLASLVPPALPAGEVRGNSGRATLGIAGLAPVARKGSPADADDAVGGLDEDSSRLADAEVGGDVDMAAREWAGCKS